jgi:regulation of enolase protein 1 (concanavalin A-like superfamily)
MKLKVTTEPHEVELLPACDIYSWLKSCIELRDTGFMLHSILTTYENKMSLNIPPLENSKLHLRLSASTKCRSVTVTAQLNT